MRRVAWSSPRHTNRPPPWSMVGSILAAGAVGGALEYLLDPERGRRRRNMARDRLAATVRRGSRSLSRTARGASTHAYSLSQKALHLQPEEWSAPNDATLVQRVESRLFRDPTIPKGQLTINAEAGVVVLRGELDRPEDIRAVEAAVLKMPGVRDVDNLLHLPGTPAPSKRYAVIPS